MRQGIPPELVDEALAGVGVGVWVLRIGTRTLYVDASVGRILGDAVEPASVDVDEHFARIHPDECLEVRARALALVDGYASRYHVRYRVTRADSRYVWVESVGHRVEHEGSAWIVGTLRDVDLEHAALDELDAARRAMQLGDERFEAYLDAGRDQIWCFECDPPIDLSLPIEEQYRLFHESRLVVANRAYATARGFDSPSKMLGQRVRELPLDSLEPLLRACRQLHAEGKLVEDVELEIPATATQPRRLWIARVRTQTRAGHLLRVWGSFTDATDRAIAEDARARAEAQYRTLLERIDELVTVVDASGVIRFASPAAERILGHPTSSRLGGSMFDLVHPDDRERVVGAFDRCVATPASELRERLRLRRLDGTWRWFDITARNLFADPAVEGVVLNGRDVTAQVEAETRVQQVQKLEALGLLAGGVAHDFNNLLTAILGQAELLRLTLPLGSEQAESVADIVHAGQRAAELTRDLLTFARRGEMQRAHVEIGTALREVARLLSRSVDRRISVQTVAPELPVFVHTDGTQLHSCLLNLGINARDAMRQGGTLTLRAREVSLSAEEASRIEGLVAGAYAEIEVEDTGTGIEPATLPRIFEPFFTTKPQGEGTGLGLAAVYGFAHGQGGAVTVTSQVGQGSTFRLLLPAVPRPQRDTARMARAAGIGAGRILVVDDETLVGDLVRRGLTRLGYEVELARHGMEAIQRVEATVGAGGAAPYDLVLMDLNMPGMSGLDAYRRIAVVDPKLPVVVMTGYGSAEALAAIDGSGVAGFITKPFRMEELGRTVRERVGRRSS